MRRAADTWRREAVLARVRLDDLDQLLHGLGRHRGVYAHNVGRHRDDADGGKILDGIIGDLGEQAWVDDEARADDEQGVSVRWGSGDHSRRRIAARARLVHDVELFAEPGRELVANDAGNDIGGTTR